MLVIHVLFIIPIYFGGVPSTASLTTVAATWQNEINVKI